jgi:hypothetical protein
MTGGKRILIGGLGFGFTLGRVLDLVPTDVHVQVSELVPAVVVWNREHLQSVNGGLVDDARVEILTEDVFTVLARADPVSVDAALFDVDNGPTALVDSATRAYADHGRMLSRGPRWRASSLLVSITGPRLHDPTHRRWLLRDRGRRQSLLEGEAPHPYAVRRRLAGLRTRHAPDTPPPRAIVAGLPTRLHHNDARVLTRFSRGSCVVE